MGAASSSGGFSVVGKEKLFEWGVSTLERVHLRAPNNEVVTREIVRHPGAVSVVPLMDDANTVVMVRQYRSAVAHTLLELPAGTRDVPGEAPIDTARRELMEEAGYSASQMTKLCDFYNSPGSSDHHHVLFLAEGLSPGARDSQGLEEEHMTIEEVRLSDAAQLIASGVVIDAKTIIGLLMARDYVAARP